MQRRYLQNGKDDVYSMKDRNEKSLRKKLYLPGIQETGG